MTRTRPAASPCRPRRCRRWPAWASRTDRARGRLLVIRGQQTPSAGAAPPHGIRSGPARLPPPSPSPLPGNRGSVMNDADQRKVVVAQSMRAAVGDHRGKALRRTQLPVQPLPQWPPRFMLFQEPGGHRIGGEQQHVAIAQAALADLDPFVQWFAVRPGADQIRAHGELRRFLQRERREHPHPLTDVIDLYESTVTNRQRRPPVRVSVNLKTEKRRERALLGIRAGEPGKRPTRQSSPPEAARRLQPLKELFPGELTAHAAS